jgi:hypothetical protein
MPPSNSYETTAVIFLDILGTTNRTSFEDKLIIHRLFHQEVESNIARQRESPHVIYKRELRSFSDCVYIFYTYKEGIEDTRKNDLNLLYICLYNTSLSILKILNSGFLVRGGATLGDCFMDDLGFFGPSVECAYHLESKKAIYPRIMIDDKIGELLFEWEQSQEIDETIELAYNTTPRLIKKDEDGGFFLNVFYELEKTELMTIGNMDLTLNDVKSQISATIERDESNQQDCKVLEKLEWMRNLTQGSKLQLNTDIATGSHSIVLGQ